MVAYWWVAADTFQFYGCRAGNTYLPMINSEEQDIIKSGTAIVDIIPKL